MSDVKILLFNSSFFIEKKFGKNIGIDKHSGVECHESIMNEIRVYLKKKIQSIGRTYV